MSPRHLAGLTAFSMLMLATSAVAQQMPGRALGLGLANPVHQFTSTTSAARIDLSQATLAKRQAPAEDIAGLIRVSRVVDLDDTSVATRWIAQPDGSAVARFTVRSEGAVGLRLRLDLPARVSGGELRAAGPAGPVEFMRITGMEQEIWTPYTEGAEQTIELRLLRPTVLPDDTEIGVGSLMHFDISPFTRESMQSVAKEASGSCNVDVRCSSTIPGLNAALEERKKSVAHLQFRRGSSGFICSGTLINSDKFPRAFLLTANHCISTAAEAASLTTFWFYENVACGQLDTGNGSRVQLAGGAQMTQTNQMVDSTLLELNGTPPNGTVYSGWDAADLADNTPVVGVSHPRGDPMKYSEGSVTEPRIRVVGYPIDLYGVSFTRGVIEGGSSGSGLFTLSASQGLQLRGILSGTTIRQAGGLSCSNLNELALYGRFEAFYPTIRPIIMNVAQTAVDVDPSMPSTSTREIAMGGSVTASIDYPGDLDVFRITVTQPGHLTVFSTGGNDLAGALLNSEGSGLVSEDDVELRNNEFGFTYRITTPGTYYVSVGHWDPAATTGNYQILARFSTATTNYSDIWWNQTESGWGLALNHQDNILAGALYTFDSDGQPLFLILNGATRQPDGSYVGPLVRSRGPAFNTLPWPASQVQRTTVGSMRLNFLGSANLDISYTVNETPVNKSLTRLTYATAPNCSFNAFDRSYARNYQDIWWNPTEDGWGLNIIHQSDIISVGLYTYDATGRDVWYLMAPGTRQSGNSIIYSGPLKRVTGPVFNAAPWTTTSETTVGTMSLAITNGNQATLQYSIDGVSVTKQVQRLTFSNPATECEAVR
ncbi:MAG: hypothetical protein SF172_18500 [Burkholderiales bacterium]|nr:hypothetical protein [Burkholderiales bacterium]